jgi:hypothetical protein
MAMPCSWLPQATHIFSTDPEFPGFDDKLLNLVPQQLRSLRVTCLGQSRHHGADARPGVQKAGRDQVGNNFMGRIGINLQILAEGAYGRKGVTWTQLS